MFDAVSWVDVASSAMAAAIACGVGMATGWAIGREQGYRKGLASLNFKPRITPAAARWPESPGPGGLAAEIALVAAGKRPGVHLRQRRPLDKIMEEFPTLDAMPGFEGKQAAPDPAARAREAIARMDAIVDPRSAMVDVPGLHVELPKPGDRLAARYAVADEFVLPGIGLAK